MPDHLVLRRAGCITSLAPFLISFLSSSRSVSWSFHATTFPLSFLSLLTPLAGGLHCLSAAIASTLRGCRPVLPYTCFFAR